MKRVFPEKDCTIPKHWGAEYQFEGLSIYIQKEFIITFCWYLY